jgi:excisionase family DNA binding protein
MKKQILEIERLSAEELIDNIVERIEATIANRNFPNHEDCPPCDSHWLTTDEAMKALQISRPTLNNLRRNGKIEYMKIGNRYRYRM